MRSMHLPEGPKVKQRVTVSILGPLKELSEASVFELEASGNESILDVLRKLPEKLKGRILEADEISPDILVLIDGVEISCLGSPKKIPVKGVREIFLIPVVHGG